MKSENLLKAKMTDRVRQKSISKSEFEKSLYSEGVTVGRQNLVNFGEVFLGTVASSVLAIALGIWGTYLVALVSGWFAAEQILPDSNPLSIERLFALIVLISTINQLIQKFDSADSVTGQLHLNVSIGLRFAPSLLGAFGIVNEILIRHPKQIPNLGEFQIDEATTIREVFPLNVLSPAILLYCAAIIAFILACHLVIEFVEAGSPSRQRIMKTQRLNRFDNLSRSYAALVQDEQRRKLVNYAFETAKRRGNSKVRGREKGDVEKRMIDSRNLGK